LKTQSQRALSYVFYFWGGVRGDRNASQLGMISLGGSSGLNSSILFNMSVLKETLPKTQQVTVTGMLQERKNIDSVICSAIVS
jgi:hypothetical protein